MIGRWFANEPVMTIVTGLFGIAQAVLVVLVEFGVPMTAKQVMAINGLVVAILCFVARGQVSPTALLQNAISQSSLAKLAVAFLAVGLLTSSCATLKAHDPFRNADGTINVPKILRWVGYGIEADCAIGQTAIAQSICVFGRDGLAAAQAAVDKNPQAGAAAASQALSDTLAHLSETQQNQLAPYFAWAIQLLGHQV